ncbi:MAG: Gfo/Idh/MocA family oxidoreductase [Candidatus Omnitrophica bacterium]|nr:Gfo/Idh/MocA family oxidoreductase [Candidatus Omnitrophota bacterium]
MNTVKIGIIGLGIGRWHLKSFLTTRGAEVIALCDANQNRLKALADEIKINRRYQNINAILKDKDIDAVSICLPNFLHAEVAVAALKSGKHVLCEKPLADNLSNAQKIAKTAEKSRKKCMVAMKFRFTPEAHYISGLLKKGKLGEVYYGYTHYLRPTDGIPTGAGNWFIQKEKSGGGALIDNGVHLLDVNWYLMGCPKPVYVFGSTYAKFGPYVEAIRNNFNVEDFGCGLIKFENGTTIYLDNAWASMVGETIIGLRICGTKGGATMWPFSVVNLKNNKTIPETPDLSNRKYQTQFEHFVECILNDSEPISPASQGVEIIKMLSGIYRSSMIGKAVRLQDSLCM